jgi:crotonobetainyl-CoA:carnitine CoA-transferase CaiB-like acyl-CoA transferase
MDKHMLAGVRVVEIADERAEYVGLVLAGLGADVIKVEPPGGSPTRSIGPFADDIADPERSLFFWSYNRGKRSVALELDSTEGKTTFEALIERADVLIDSTARDFLASVGSARNDLLARYPRLIVSRMTDFGDDGPWAAYKASDLVHLALGGQMMNSGYSPRPDGTYDLPPMAGQAWQSYHIAGEQLALATVAALRYRESSGSGQLLSCAIHEATAKNTELDVMSWVFRRIQLNRQTCQHAGELAAAVPPIVHTKDGRWFMVSIAREGNRLVPFLQRYGMAMDLSSERDAGETGSRPIPGSSELSEEQAVMIELLQRLIGRFTYDEAPWREAQEAGLLFVPVRRPEENLHDEHWQMRGTFSQIEHPELGRSFTYVTSKWISTATAWKAGRRAPLLDEDRAVIQEELKATPPASVVAKSVAARPHRLSPRGKPSALDGIRVFDFSWFLASAGGTRFLGAMGAEVIKVEWAAHPDTRTGVMAPIGGRAAREAATSPLPGVTDPDMGGQFNNKNAGKRGMSLNVRHPEGLEIARRLIAISDVVAEGFSPGVLDRWGLGYEALREIKQDIIYAQQSGMGSQGIYGRFRAIGPIAASLAGITEMSGLPEPALPAGWGYSYLDWIGAYSFGLAIVSALFHRGRTGEGQWIDASQTETGIFISGVSLLDYSVNGRGWSRIGNRSPWKPAAPHGAFACASEDGWISFGCFTEEEWQSLCRVAGHSDWAADPRFKTLGDRLTHQDALEELVSSWTKLYDRYDLMRALQEAGIPAGVCQTGGDKVDSDPQLAHLEWLTEVTGSKIGRWPVGEVPVKMSETPTYIGGSVDRGAPCYGEDNEYVLGELLGYDTKAIAKLAEDGVI